MHVAKQRIGHAAAIDGTEDATEQVFVRTDLADLLRLIDDSRLGVRLSTAQQTQLIRCAEIRRYAPEEAIFREGERADSIAVVIQGTVEVRKAIANQSVHRLASMSRGAALGESALTGDRRRSADVFAVAPTQILVIKLDDSVDRNWLGAVALELMDTLTQRSRRTTEHAVDAAIRQRLEETRRNEIARFLTLLIVGMCAYTVSLGFVSTVVDQPVINSIVTNLSLLAIVVATVGLIRTSAYPFAFFGLRIGRRWRTDIGEALALALLMSVGATVLKWLLVSGPTPFSGQPVFNPTFGVGSTTAATLLTVIYVAVCPVQELIARGVLQGTAFELFRGQRFAVALSIVLSNAMFAASHAHVSVWLALTSFGAGILWGILYHRQRSLLGVSICHALVGVYGLEILGFWSLGRPG